MDTANVMMYDDVLYHTSQTFCLCSMQLQYVSVFVSEHGKMQHGNSVQYGIQSSETVRVQ